MDAYTLTAISALVTGLLSGIGILANNLVTVYNARQQAKRDEMQLLRDEVARLHAQNAELEGESDRHRLAAQRAGTETLWLRTFLQQQKLTAPPLPPELAPEAGPGAPPPSVPPAPGPSSPPFPPVSPPGLYRAEPPRGPIPEGPSVPNERR